VNDQQIALGQPSKPLEHAGLQKLRTRAEVDADIALVIRRIVTPDDTDTAQDSGTWDRIRALCSEATA
jgi:hypothetical protein